MTKISIIVPVYNSERYLAKCLDSLVGQTLKDIEIILINDGSTDGSAKIIETYAKKYRNIVVINQKNQGTGVARQAGITASTGEYIGFVDNDDFVDPSMYKKLYNKAKLTDSDVVLCSYYKYQNGEKTPKNINFPKDRDFYPALEAKDMFASYFIWATIQRRSLFDKYNITIPKIATAEDTSHYLQIMASSKKVSFLRENLYYYRENTQSFSKTKNKQALGFFEAMQVTEDFLIDNNFYKDYENIFNHLKLTLMLSFLSYRVSFETRKEFFRQAKTMLQKTPRKHIKKLKPRKQFLLFLIEKGWYTLYIVLADFHKPFKKVSRVVRGKK
ncbi:MAG: glycosyltransferase [Elusimicrobiaceae bacterium]|jgi:glycosyltransferase involved in cell wall biosynthesis|nr:glycosyltransferase [Elusimicrobiaceae bacterium]MBT4008580.1 glycosyltransferase [Elusimicrobiaceae bacterium]MBT4402982.1 glycosyltransferase [Elusimicrobiaceae bacterium]MBT4439746.1 glycosyltransferase [Elusimicrobiaceae bacterium]MBT5987809.1 glycosyltransferase [Elusimicrobiaceae bacterium]